MLVNRKATSPCKGIKRKNLNTVRIALRGPARTTSGSRRREKTGRAYIRRSSSKLDQRSTGPQPKDQQFSQPAISAKKPGGGQGRSRGVFLQEFKQKSLGKAKSVKLTLGEGE